MPSLRSTSVALTLGLALLLTGACGGGDDDDVSTATTDEETTTTSGDTPSGDGDECRFVPTSAVQEVFGDAMELKAAGQGCAFGDGEITLQFTYIAVQIDPEQYADEALEASCDEGTAVEVDAGDRAYACVSYVGPLGNLYEGRDLVVINTYSVEDEDEETVRDQLAELLPSVTSG